MKNLTTALVVMGLASCGVEEQRATKAPSAGSSDQVTEPGDPDHKSTEILEGVSDKSVLAFPSVGNDFASKGSFAVTPLENDGPGAAFAIHEPKDLGAGGLKHPIITWGNGTGATPRVYAGLLTHLASHGFIVIASNSTNTGAGTEMLEGVTWLIAENARPGSKYFDKIDAAKVCASGHSQGGGGAIKAGADPRITCTLPIEPAPASVAQLKGPVLYVAGSEDNIVNPKLLVYPLFQRTTVPTIYAENIGATHFTPIGDAGVMRAYFTAWFRWQLLDDPVAKEVFIGTSCGLCLDQNWEVEKKGI